jgi:hypothetical protein
MFVNDTMVVVLNLSSSAAQECAPSGASSIWQQSFYLEILRKKLWPTLKFSAMAETK